MKMIKYQYAKDENENLIDINILNRENINKSKYFCIGCGNELIARLGKIKIHHFAHKNVVNCSGETYLHLLGKKLFFDNYNDCLVNKKPFYIEIYEQRDCNHYEKDFGIKCKHEKTLTKYDLTQFFDKVSLEKRAGSFVADVMLTSKDEQDNIFIEIAVTHSSTEEKLNSSFRIIELKIEGEEDFASIKRKCLSVIDPKTIFKNFKIKEITESICNGDCQVDYYLLTLNTDGRFLVSIMNLKQIKHTLSVDKKIIKHEIVRDENNWFNVFKKGLATFAEKKLTVRNCFICRYHAKNDLSIYGTGNCEGKTIFCKFLKVNCGSNSAVKCKYFKKEEKYIDELLQGEV